MIEKLQRVEKLVGSSKWIKFQNFPKEYFYAFFFRKFIFPLFQKPHLVKSRTFFNDTFYINLPAAIDIYIYGAKSHVSEINLSKFLINFLKEGNTFVDIGAHFGFFSSLAALLVGKNGKIHSFEAAPKTFEVLRLNCVLSQIKLYQKACSNRNQLVSFYEFPLSYSEYNSLNDEQYKNKTWRANQKVNEIKIQAVKIDDVLNENFINIVKIDVEGAEFLVLKGMENKLRKKEINFLIVEFLKDNVDQKNILNFLKNWSYFPFCITPEGRLKQIENNDIASYLNRSNLDSDNIVFKTLNK